MSGRGQEPPEPPGATPPRTSPPRTGPDPAHREAEDRKIEAAVRALQQGGDPSDFAPIYHRFFPGLHRFFANRPSLREQADELAQETLLKAYQNIHQFRHEARFSTWLRKIAQNVWINADRKAAADKRSVDTVPLELEDTEGEARPLEVAEANFYGERPAHPAQVAAALDRERTQVLNDALAELPEGQRRSFELWALEDLKYREIAEHMGVDIGTVKSQISAARKRLRPLVSEYFGVDL